MPITDADSWKKWVDSNQDPYGKCCVDVAREVMRLLDDRPGDFDPHKLICEADDNIKAGGITGFMAGATAHIISKCHSRGKEFQEKWNHDNQIHDEGDRATAKGRTLNPAIITISPK